MSSPDGTYQPPLPYGGGPPAPLFSPPTPSGDGSPGRAAALAAIGTLAAVTFIGVAYLIGASGKSDPDPTTTTAVVTTTALPATTAPPPVVMAETTIAPPAPIGDVRQAAEGLLCKDLSALGYSYSASVDYWRLWGQPNRMDADKNGIPCETVYPRADVVAYWPETVYGATVSYGLPSGLLCRDLQDRGVDVYDALRYYIWEGYPARMDADGNGIPCETVYYDASDVWLYEL